MSSTPTHSLDLLILLNALYANRREKQVVYSTGLLHNQGAKIRRRRLTVAGSAPYIQRHILH